MKKLIFMFILFMALGACTKPGLNITEVSDRGCTQGKCHYHYKYTYSYDCYYNIDMKRICKKVKVPAGKVWVCHSIVGGL